MPVKIKICGITNHYDAQAVVQAGGDALGFMFYEPSPRHVSLELAAKIIRDLPPFLAKVGVFVNPSEEEVRRAIEQSGIDTLQFHGDETPEFCGLFKLKTIKAFRVRDRESLQSLEDYQTDAWLLDSYVPGKLGGTGALFNWELAVEAKTSGKPIILAGGLKPDNVAEAVQQVRPFAIDVSSGVEVAPGKKDPELIKDFIDAVRQTSRFL